jgi:hypothetical protein
LPEAVNDRITEKRKTDILCSEYKLFQVYVNKIRKKSIGSATFITIFSRKGPPVISQMANDLPTTLLRRSGYAKAKKGA